MKEKISKIVREAIEELNEDFLEDEKIVYEKDRKLFGVENGIDSLSFTRLITDVEDRIYDEFDKEVYLVAASVYEKKYNPFKTIGIFEEYIEEVISQA